MYSDIFNTSGEEMLKNGGCYEFVKIMQNKFVGSKMYLRFDSNHCAVLIDDILYDVEGVVKNKEDYHEANQKIFTQFSPVRRLLRCGFCHQGSASPSSQRYH